MYSQSDADKGTLMGIVSDPNEGPIPHAAVTAKNLSTGLERQTLTNDSGQYRFPALEPGLYSLSVQGPAFSASVNQVQVNVGVSMKVNISVTLQSTSVDVNLGSSFISVVDTHNNQIIPRDAIRDLPIDGRRFQDFATLTPGAVALPETRGQLSFVGQRGVNGNVMVDGLDYNDPFVGGVRGGDRSTFAFTIPQSAVREFQAVAAGYSAEYGRSTGGLLNAITRSGDNDLHGDSFYQIRDTDLSLETPLHQASLQRQQQFGGGVGGPLVRQKAFFFGSAEQQFASYPRQVRFSSLDSLASQITPDIAPAYQYFRSLEQPYRQTNNATAALGRIDYHLTKSTQLTARYQFSRNYSQNGYAGSAASSPSINVALSANGNLADKIQLGSIQLSHVAGSFVNDFRAQYGWEGSSAQANSAQPFVQAGVIGSVGTDQFLPSKADDYRLQLADGLTVVAGRHGLKMGIDFNRIGFNRTYGANQYGGFFVSTADVARILRMLSAAGTNRFDDSTVLYRRQQGGLQSSASALQVGGFFEDHWQVHPTFSLTYGVRWEGQVNPSPALGNDFITSNVRDFQYPIGKIDPGKIRNQLDQWAPRAGFAWDIAGKGSTVIRAQAGLFYAETPLLLYAAPIGNFAAVPVDVSTQLGPAAGQNIYQRFLSGGFDLNQTPLGSLPVLSPQDVWQKMAKLANPWLGSRISTTSGERFRNPRSAQIGLGIAHQLIKDLVVDYSLNRLNTVHLVRNVDYNVPAPVIRPGDLSLTPFFGLRSGTPRANPNLAWLMVRDSSAHANYLSQTFRVQYRRKRLQLAMHYTLSYNKSDDDTERVLTEISYQNPFNFSRDYNWSSLDSRHQIGAYAVYSAPMGIEISSLFHYRSALPVDPNTGADTSELATTNLTTRPMERPGLPFLRNSFRNRDYRSVDLRIMKDLFRKESTRIQFSCELFNVFNFQNIGFISSSVLPNNPAFVYGPGLLTTGQVAPVDTRFLRLRLSNGDYDPATTAQVGLPFQAQLGLRIVF